MFPSLVAQVSRTRPKVSELSDSGVGIGLRYCQFSTVHCTVVVLNHSVELHWMRKQTQSWKHGPEANLICLRSEFPSLAQVGLGTMCRHTMTVRFRYFYNLPVYPHHYIYGSDSGKSSRTVWKILEMANSDSDSVQQFQNSWLGLGIRYFHNIHVTTYMDQTQENQVQKFQNGRLGLKQCAPIPE